MATPAGNDTVSNTVSTATAIPLNDDITAGQRMISASAGNILTGLLGECFPVEFPDREASLLRAFY